MDKITILWVDDEIDGLKSQILFLEGKGYDVVPTTNGQDALDKVKETNFDIVFLDEQMPGMSGLETLAQIKEMKPTLPVVMITKSEEEDLMDDAIGSKISDYLIKPVNPNQIQLTIKKILDNKRLISEKSTHNYQQEFQKISLTLSDNLNHEEWASIYKKLIYWELELGKSEDKGVADILTMQKNEANNGFCKFIKNNYFSLLEKANKNEMIMSHNLMRTSVFPHVEDNYPVFMILIDNLRYDQWKTIEPVISEYFNLESDKMFYSILPSTTQYSRNAIFAGLTPAEIERHYPDLWLNDDEEGGKNMHESELLTKQIGRLGKTMKVNYEKITKAAQGKAIADNIKNMMHNDLNVIIFNFVDMLSHARTESDIIKELANDEAAYRTLTSSWFEHSPLLDIIRSISEEKIRLIITTDHGTIRVKEPSKVVGDRHTSTNLRYKHGKNLKYEDQDVLAVADPGDVELPRPHVSSSYIFAYHEKYLVYPNNYNHFVNLYKNTFQHGGISLEEMIIPIGNFVSG
ncbi:MAG: PglZ domain-containing protein [Bacteroidetes bacterium]|nr:PglZ domain-containing protein [Bacteroidota bacterium]